MFRINLPINAVAPVLYHPCHDHNPPTLPNELMRNILKYVCCPGDLGRCSQASRHLRQVVRYKLIRGNAGLAVKILQILFKLGNEEAEGSLPAGSMVYEDFSRVMSLIWKESPVGGEMRLFLRSTASEGKMKPFVNLTMRHLSREGSLKDILSSLTSQQRAQFLDLCLELYSEDLKTFLAENGCVESHESLNQGWNNPVLDTIFFLMCCDLCSVGQTSQDILKICKRMGGEELKTTLSAIYGFLVYLKNKFSPYEDSMRHDNGKSQIEKLLSQWGLKDRPISEHIVSFASDFIGSDPNSQVAIDVINTRATKTLVDSLFDGIGLSDHELSMLTSVISRSSSTEGWVLDYLHECLDNKMNSHWRTTILTRLFNESATIFFPLSIRKKIVTLIWFLINPFFTDSDIDVDDMKSLSEMLELPHQFLLLLLSSFDFVVDDLQINCFLRRCAHKIQKEEKIQEVWRAYMTKMILAEGFYNSAAVNLCMKMVSSDMCDLLFRDLGKKGELFIYFALESYRSADRVMKYILSPDRDPSFLERLDWLSCCCNQSSMLSKTQDSVWKLISSMYMRDINGDTWEFDSMSGADFVKEAQRVFIFTKHFLRGERRTARRRNLLNEVKKRLEKCSLESSSDFNDKNTHLQLSIVWSLQNLKSELEKEECSG